MNNYGQTSVSTQLSSDLDSNKAYTITDGHTVAKDSIELDFLKAFQDIARCQEFDGLQNQTRTEVNFFCLILRLDKKLNRIMLSIKLNKKNLRN